MIERWIVCDRCGERVNISSEGRIDFPWRGWRQMNILEIERKFPLLMLGKETGSLRSNYYFCPECSNALDRYAARLRREEEAAKAGLTVSQAKKIAEGLFATVGRS